MLGFDVAGGLLGTTRKLKSCTLTLDANAFVRSSLTGKAVIGTHNFGPTAIPDPVDFLDPDSVIRNRLIVNLGLAIKTIDLGKTIGNEFMDDSVAPYTRGIIIGPGPTDSEEYYANFVPNATNASACKLKLEYYYK